MKKESSLMKFQIAWILFRMRSFVGIRSLFALWSLVFIRVTVAQHTDCSRTSPQEPIAVVNGTVITAADLDHAVQPQREALEAQVRRLRKAMLNKLINNKLLEQAAESENRTLDDYLELQLDSVLVSDDDVDQAYTRSRDKFSGTIPAEAKYRIRRGLEDNRRAKAIRSLVERLRRAGEIRSYLVEQIVDPSQLAADQGPSFGPADAPITIVEFSDFECRFCSQAAPILRGVIEKWPGKVRLVFKHFPLPRHRNAFEAAVFSECAARQGVFWEFHDRVLQSDRLSRDKLLVMAVDMGLDRNAVQECATAEEAAARIRSDIVLAKKVGVSATPTIFVNGLRVGSPADVEHIVHRLVNRLSDGRGYRKDAVEMNVDGPREGGF